ncbi:tetratricopeptide repeat protein [Caenimonas soli]|uniref:tetratricopeptide repeat protein n=1 Tax=Caenimonas soli TaxID=2735555 RepID=UPI0015541D28|nr:tetratricopeptide repeat protein [Caenimonas soli]NPC58306.1 tetratricopeptide repeat protein [Caenimonas soli]
MLEDRYGLPLSTTSTAARDAYVAGVDCVLSGVAGYRELLAQAIAFDPSFALAHVALARGLFLDADFAAARESVIRARELAAHATPREQSHTDVICLALEGKPAQAMQAMLVHLRSWPRDAMVLAPATSVFGLYGFSGDPAREDQLYQLLDALAPAYGQDWWFESVHSFAACETGRLDLAWTLIERSLAQTPRHDAHAAHFRIHVMYERGESDAALEYLEGWMPRLDKRSLMHCHLSWHVALAALATGRRERAWEAYRTGVHPGGAWGPPLNVVTDAASFLWRAELAGEPRSALMWRQVHDHASRSFPKAGVAYADVHSLLACVADGDTPTLERLLGEIRQRIAAGRYPPGEVVIWIANGFAAYASGDWNGAIRCLEQALPQTVRIGGSRAQRDLVSLTLAAAYIKADRPEEASALIARAAHRPHGISSAAQH